LIYRNVLRLKPEKYRNVLGQKVEKHQNVLAPKVGKHQIVLRRKPEKHQNVWGERQAKGGVMGRNGGVESGLHKHQTMAIRTLERTT